MEGFEDVFGGPPPVPHHSTALGESGNDLITLDSWHEHGQQQHRPHILTKCGLLSWNVKFNGTSDVRDFIYTVEELLAARGIPEPLLLANFHDLLGDTALAWFRVNKHRFTSWFQIKYALISNFEPVDYTYNVVTQLRNTKQQPNQSLLEFTSHMRYMANKIAGNLSEVELFEIIKHNMLPKYYPAIMYGAVNSIDSLISIGKNIDSFLPLQTNTVNNPQLTYSPVNNNNCEKKAICNAHHVATCSVNNRNLCFKCRGAGHFYRECPSRTTSTATQPNTPAAIPASASNQSEAAVLQQQEQRAPASSKNLQQHRAARM